MQALKTGFTREAGYNLAIAAWREGQRFLLIVMGAQTRSLSFRDAKQLLRYGFIESGFEIAEEPRQPTPPRPAGRRTNAGATPCVPARPAAVSPLGVRTGRRSTMATPKAFIFDAYGTLFDVHSVVEAGRALTRDPQALSLLWRQKQLEYTWLRTLMGRYEDFWAVTEAALRFALGRLGIAAGDEAVARLMEAYLSLATFPDVAGALAGLAGTPLGILSNGSPRMLDAAVRSSGLAGTFRHVLSVDAVRAYKPSPTVYELGPRAFGVPAGDILFVSSNAWDVAGAKAFGYRTCWCNRLAAPMDRLGVSPDFEVRTLDEIPGSWASRRRRRGERPLVQLVGEATHEEIAPHEHGHAEQAVLVEQPLERLGLAHGFPGRVALEEAGVRLDEEAPRAADEAEGAVAVYGMRVEGRLSYSTCASARARRASSEDGQRHVLS